MSGATRTTSLVTRRPRRGRSVHPCNGQRTSPRCQTHEASANTEHSDRVQPCLQPWQAPCRLSTRRKCVERPTIGRRDALEYLKPVEFREHETGGMRHVKPPI